MAFTSLTLSFTFFQATVSLTHLQINYPSRPISLPQHFMVHTGFPFQCKMCPGFCYLWAELFCLCSKEWHKCSVKYHLSFTKGNEGSITNTVSEYHCTAVFVCSILLSHVKLQMRSSLLYHVIPKVILTSLSTTAQTNVTDLTVHISHLSHPRWTSDFIISTVINHAMKNSTFRLHFHFLGY